MQRLHVGSVSPQSPPAPLTDPKMLISEAVNDAVTSPGQASGSSQSPPAPLTDPELASLLAGFVDFQNYKDIPLSNEVPTSPGEDVNQAKMSLALVVPPEPEQVKSLRKSLLRISSSPNIAADKQIIFKSLAHRLGDVSEKIEIARNKLDKSRETINRLAPRLAEWKEYVATYRSLEKRKNDALSKRDKIEEQIKKKEEVINSLESERKTLIAEHSDIASEFQAASKKIVSIRHKHLSICNLRCLQRAYQAQLDKAKVSVLKIDEEWRAIAASCRNALSPVAQEVAEDLIPANAAATDANSGNMSGP